MKHYLADDAALYTDLYQLTMAQGYLFEGNADRTACFDYFFRSNPFGSGYTVFSGLSQVVDLLSNFHFHDGAIDYLSDQGFAAEFLDHLSSLELGLEVNAPPEGELVFPYEPVVRVRGPLLQAQLVESLLLNTLNFSSLIATKASRMRRVAGDRKLIDFGLRRAQGMGALQASRAAYIGGFESTSNVLAGRNAHIPVAGTQAHSWIQSFDDELSAFRAYARQFPDQCILLVDTYDTLNSGIPNAIEVAGELREQGHELVGIRLDSGDLAYLSKKARQMLDDAGFPDVKIAASNQLDEYVIKSLVGEQDAAIDVFGVGTQLVTAYDDAALDGVYKLCEVDGDPRIKISENREKVNFPSAKRVFRLLDDHGQFYGDAIALESEDEVDHIVHPHDPYKDVAVGDLDQQPLLETVIDDGQVIADLHDIEQARDYARRRLQQLPDEHKRFDNPHIYKVGLSDKLNQLRHGTLQQARISRGVDDRG